MVEASWNVMTHAQKPDFFFRRNGRVHLNRRGCQFSRLLAAEVCASAVVMLDTPCSEVVRRVLATHSIRQFPLHFPSRAWTMCHHISTGLSSKTAIHNSGLGGRLNQTWVVACESCRIFLYRVLRAQCSTVTIFHFGHGKCPIQRTIMTQQLWWVPLYAMWPKWNLPKRRLQLAELTLLQGYISLVSEKETI
jgi:hypothetical protein